MSKNHIFDEDQGLDSQKLLHQPLIEEDYETGKYKAGLQEPSEAGFTTSNRVVTQAPLDTSLKHEQATAEDRIDQLLYLVNQKVESHKAEKAKSQEQAPYSQILTTFADGKDKALIGLGYATAIITGLGLPSFVFIFGDIINSFGPNQKNVVDAMRPIAIQMTVIGAFIWLTTYLYFTFLVVMSERVGRKTRVAYLKAILQ